MRDGPTVAVIGGGVIGSAIAWRLASEGARVTLIERGPAAPTDPFHRAGPASPAAAGMLAPLKEAGHPGPGLDLGLRSLDRYPAFVEAVEAAAGMAVGYRRDGRLDVALDEDGATALRRQARLQAEVGYPGRLLDPDELGDIEPAVSPRAVLALATDHDHQVDARRLTAALRAAAATAGVDLRAGTAAGGVVVGETGSPGRSGGARRGPGGSGGAGRGVAGVALESGGEVSADVVVVAAGAWSGGLALPRPLPVRPVRGQIVVLRAEPGLLSRITWGPDVYLVPRGDGRLLVGSTMEEAGFDARVTDDAVDRLLTAAHRLVPALADTEIDGYQVGLRPAAPDGLPIIGPDPNVDGLFYATAHFRNGILLAPETAERITAMVLAGEPGEPAFAPARFGDPESGRYGSEQSRV